MRSKLYLLLVILSIFVIGSISVVDQKPARKNDSSLDSKKKVGIQDQDDNYNRHKDKHENYDNDDDEVDDNHMSLSSYADNRYSASAFGPPENNYRTRERWPASPPSSSSLFLQPSQSSSLDDFLGGNDWPRFEFSNPFPAPLPSMSFDNGPSCYSLVDPQYPIFSDTCGAVPQARYSLPNSFGHRERWQAAQVLSALVGSSTDPACTRSLRLLLCPVLFPPCQARHEPPPVLPCQSYCRAVKARCAIPTLDLLPCEVLPYSSDLCPTNQAYGSFIPPGAYPSANQPSPMISGLSSSNYPMNNGLSSSNYPMNNGFSQSNYPMNSGLSSSNYPMNSGFSQSNYQMNNGLPSSNYQMSRSFPSIQSLVSSQGFQSTLTPSSPQSAPAQSVQSAAPMNLYNGGQYATDSLSPMLVDFPSRSYNNDYRQGSRYAPLTRSSTETRPANDARSQSITRPSAAPSVVKA